MPRPPRQGGAAQKRRRVDLPRQAALDVLVAVRADEAYTNLVLPATLARHGLSGRDAGFVTELASGTIRRQGTYDAIIAACSDRPLVKVQAKVLDVLRLGAHQLLAMRVPDHAAISATVDLARDRVGAGAAGFVNAVLRKVAAHDLDAWIRRVSTDATFSSVAYSHPAWVVERLAEALGERAAELDDLLEADNVSPRVTLVARPGLAERDELVAAGAEALPFSPYAAALLGGNPGEVPAVAEGRAGVQDEGSQLVALGLAHAALGGPDLNWLDLCAGPGGKAALLAALAGSRGSRVLAVERQPHRAGLVARATAATRTGLRGVVCADGTRPAWPSGYFDRVLVDAPCSGLGALRRRPEARWRRQPSDLDALVPLQQALLDSALDAVRPGGLVLYATCSPVLAETADVVTEAVARHPGVMLEDLSAAGALAEIPDAVGPLPGTVQLWPHRHGTDAMFLALLRRP